MSDINKEIEYISSLKLSVHELRKYYDRIDDSEVKENLKNVIVISNKIYKEVVVNSDKVYKVNNFIKYYINTVKKVVEKYVTFKEAKVHGKDFEELYSKMNGFLEKVYIGFNKIYESLFSSEIIDIDAEIKIMFKEMNI